MARPVVSTRARRRRPRPRARRLGAAGRRPRRRLPTPSSPCSADPRAGRPARLPRPAARRRALRLEPDRRGGAPRCWPPASGWRAADRRAGPPVRWIMRSTPTAGTTGRACPARVHKRTGASCGECGEYTPVDERILIVKLDAMGDVLRTTACLEPLKRQHPRSHVTWITRCQRRPAARRQSARRSRPDRRVELPRVRPGRGVRPGARARRRPAVGGNHAAGARRREARLGLGPAGRRRPVERRRRVVVADGPRRRR